LTYLLAAQKPATGRSRFVPQTVGASVETLLGAHGQPQRLKRLFDRSPIPMVIVDNERRYIEANRPARLAFRLSLAELRELRVDDLTPPEELPAMEAAHSRLLDTGCAVGSYEVALPDGSHLHVVYFGVANALPGLHLGAFTPAGWPDGELDILDDDPGPVPPLTPRELELLQLAAEGWSGPRIAEELVLSPGTVKTHFQNIYSKLGVRDRVAAVAKAMRLGLIG
jgi:PAS domain S-box-containing protein